MFYITVEYYNCDWNVVGDTNSTLSAQALYLLGFADIPLGQYEFEHNNNLDETGRLEWDLPGKNLNTIKHLHMTSHICLVSPPMQQMEQDLMEQWTSQLRQKTHLQFIKIRMAPPWEGLRGYNPTVRFDTMEVSGKIAGDAGHFWFKDDGRWKTTNKNFIDGLEFNNDGTVVGSFHHKRVC